TLNPEVKILLPNHRLHLQRDRHSRYGLISANPYKEVPWLEKIEVIHQLWNEQLEQLFEMSPEDTPIGISLSGGLDSRTVLAHMKPYLHKTRAFTYTARNVRTGEKPRDYWQQTMVADYKILSAMMD